MSFFSNYGPKTIGRCMYFIQYYCGLHVAETCTFGESGVHLCDENDATIEWDEEGNPHFTFLGSMARFYGEQQEINFERAKGYLSKEYGK